MSEKPFLSKSTFIRGMQCEKSLYLHLKRPFLRDKLSDEQKAKFQRGHRIGAIAREVYPGGIDLSPASPFQMARAVKRTAECIKEGAGVMYEAAFEHGGVRVLLDILVKGASGWHAIEVKSSFAISETFLWDASLQFYVIKGSGLEMADFRIMYVDPAFDRDVAEPDPAKMFLEESVLGIVLENQEMVAEKIQRFRAVTQMNKSPDIDVGAHCHSPYPCDFIGHCHKNLNAGLLKK